MRGKIDLSAQEVSALTPWFKGGIYILENTNDWDELDLTIMNLSPEQVTQMLNFLGYEEISHEDNGWEQDTYYYYTHKNHNELCFFYSGHYGTMNLSLIR